MSDNTSRLKVIRDEVLNFTQSPLYTYRVENGYYPVIGEGNHQADLMFVGEAPGEKEAQTARPFCGASGKVLDQLFASIGLSRSQVYITNIVKDRPPGNRDPKPEEIEMYAPFLDRQIEIIQPKVLVTLGRFSMEYLMRRYGLQQKLAPISRIHGQLFYVERADFIQDLAILPLYHPAVALYNPKTKETLLQDIQIVKSLGV